MQPNKSNPMRLNDALTKAKAVAEKLKNKEDQKDKGIAKNKVEAQTGTKRNREEIQEDYQAVALSQNSTLRPQGYKRSAFDSSAAKPYHINELRKHGQGSQERKVIYSTPYAPLPGQEDYSVPNHMVGLLIGKGGENLKKIERMSGVTKVQFDNDPIGSERVVHIIGEADQIAIARDMIRQMVTDAQVNDSSNMSGVGASDQPSLVFRIPSNKVGLVIGRGGETLRDFQERSKAKIMIASDSYGDRNQERVITIVGNETAAHLAKTLIEELIFGSDHPSGQILTNNAYDPNQYNSAYALYGYNTVPRPDDDSAFISVPSFSVGLIIGKGGETIRSIQDQSGARVKVAPTSDPNPEQRVVNILGDPKCVAHAKRLVEEKANEAIRSSKAGRNILNNQQSFGTDYNQYNQYYSQYGYDSQYHSGDPSHMQYTNYTYPYTNNMNIPAVNVSKNASTADYYSQFYSGQTSITDQQAYYQWYQDYYHSTANNGHPDTQPQHGNDNKSKHNEEKTREHHNTDKKEH